MDQRNSDEVRSLGIKPILVDDLHAKIYMNGKVGIVTSMNLTQSSDDKSIEIGYMTETEVEYEELESFFKSNIENGVLHKKPKKPIHQPERKRSESRKDSSVRKEPSYGYVMNIKKHISDNYDVREEIKWRDGMYELRFFDFLRKGNRIFIEPYEHALKLWVNFPKYKPPKESLRKLNSLELSLSQSNELAFYEDENEFKYYFKDARPLVSWSKNKMMMFIKDWIQLLILALNSPTYSSFVNRLAP